MRKSFFRVSVALTSLVVAVSACDESGSDSSSILEGEGPSVSLSTLLHDSDVAADAASERTGSTPNTNEVEYWLGTVDKELGYARALDSYWTESVREAVGVATSARQRANSATGLAREAAAAEARDVLDQVPWDEWTTTLIACVDDLISADDLAQARDSRSGRDPAWQARVRRADRLRKGAGEAMREQDARRSLQRAFYACELASQVAGTPLEVG